MPLRPRGQHLASNRRSAPGAACTSKSDTCCRFLRDPSVPRPPYRRRHDAEEGSPVNSLLVFVPLIIWVIVAVLLAGEPFLALLAAGGVYGIGVAAVHNIFWSRSPAHDPPRLDVGLEGRLPGPGGDRATWRHDSDQSHHWSRRRCRLRGHRMVDNTPHPPPPTWHGRQRCRRSAIGQMRKPWDWPGESTPAMTQRPRRESEESHVRTSGWQRP